MATLYPSSYGRTLLDIDALFARHHVDKMHPEFARRLRPWLVAQGGHIGIGGSWRDTGSQPDKPGFAPEGRSFHQYQRFASGLIKFAAVDLVARNGSSIHRAPYWSEVPAQDSADAAKWGVHCNVSSEAWHMQPIEIDGWVSWMGAHSPDPVTGYPVPGDPLPPPKDSTVTRYFTTRPVPAPLWRTDNNKDAHYVDATEWVDAGMPKPTLDTKGKYRFWIEATDVVT